MNLVEFLNKFNRNEYDIETIYNKGESEKAVENNGYALRYVKDQTEKICEKAVENNGYALRYVDKTIFKEDKKEITISEIEKLLGYSVKIIKD